MQLSDVGSQSPLTYKAQCFPVPHQPTLGDLTIGGSSVGPDSDPGWIPAHPGSWQCASVYTKQRKQIALVYYKDNY